MLRRIAFLVLSVLCCVGACLTVSVGGVYYDDGAQVKRGADPAIPPEGLVALDAEQRWKTVSGNFLTTRTVEADDDSGFSQPIYILKERAALLDFASPLSLDAHQTLSMYCMVRTEPGASGYGYLNFRLYTADDLMVSQAAIPVNNWCVLQFDLGAWAGRNAIRHIEMEVTGPGESGTTEFCFSGLWVDEPMNAELRERFMTDSFSIRGGNVYLSAGVPYAYIIPTDSSPILEANVLPPSAQTETNALRLVLDNESACTSLTLQYSYSADGANARSATLSVGSGSQTLLFSLERAGELRYLRLIFTGAGEGLITIHAINPVSVYDSGIRASGSIDACELGETENEILVRGTVPHNIMIANRENKLALFALAPWETGETALTDGRSPVAVADMSIRYSFSVPLEEGDYAALGAMYVVALQSAGAAEGEYLYSLLTSPKSVSVSYRPPDTASAGAVKGVQTSLVSTAGQAGASLYLIDLELDRLCDGNAAGYRYIRGDKSYYFNREVLSALDREIQLRSAAGAAVYLRFLLSADGPEVPYALSSAEVLEGTNRGILLDDDSSRDLVAAITEFLTERYAEVTDYGTIVGIVVGEQVDDAAVHNFLGTYSLSDYVDRYADLLTLIANVGRVKNPALKVIVPISDRRPAVCITPALLEDSYDSELFLRSLFMRLDEFGGPDVSLMLESGHNPFLAPYDVSAQAEDGAGYYQASDLGDFSDLLDNLSSLYRAMPETFSYLWSPADETGETLTAAYAYLYYRLRFSTHAEAFIVSFAAAEAEGNMRGMRDLRYLMKYIDTDRSLEVSEPSLAVFGADSWSALIDGFDARKLALYSYTEGTLEESTAVPTGSYSYWDFSSSYSTRGWYAGAHIADASVKGSGDARALVGTFDRSTAQAEAYCELVYRFDRNEPVGLLDRLSFDLMLSGDGAWEICIFIGNSDARMEQKCVLEAGRRVTLSLDPAPLAEMGARYIKLCAKPISDTGEGQIHLYGVQGESDTLEDEALDEALAAARSADADSGEDDGSQISTPWIFAITAVLIASAAIVIFLGRKREN